MFKDPRFVCVFFGTSFALFPLFVPPFFLPLYASSLGLSPLAGPLLLAGFNLSSALGRIGFGLGADRLLGSLNAMILCLAVFGTLTMLLWPFATSLVPLAVFAVVNGAVAGATLEVTFGMMVSGWAGGYALGAPIAGYILAATGGAGAGYVAFRPAFFYAGALALFACGLICCARVIESKDLKKRV
ncbi:hypothetical protein MVLG_01660 [Microbotryum lychnidis-dioicae p1A1 Lamole]|uniref:Major facilitator superfamily (MFS) profile domain-containing protein n=1 Tax=Microbotryum lychnidis-dioicae (strain p1A1 Lamole / MvSl-1064) TaxID=683840 RepID=U5H2S8_USTV1|nr:hypothetical protein MVLG_01660 [Microbotryum lychnidis-dioicae p1A1 Lamole]|eukprot:KDE08181.1 hypothetical protein MVLG_01660 [Microbotryum lychnidis-dioicae p1A1 Lamole]